MATIISTTHPAASFATPLTRRHFFAAISVTGATTGLHTAQQNTTEPQQRVAQNRTEHNTLQRSHSRGVASLSPGAPSSHLPLLPRAKFRKFGSDCQTIHTLANNCRIASKETITQVIFLGEVFKKKSLPQR